MRHSIDYAREKLEARLAELPDGEWREVQYIDHDGHAPKSTRSSARIEAGERA